MDRFFVEQNIDDLYRVAVIDKHRIFSSNNPGRLATVFECSKITPTLEDNAQIFYAMAPSIGADNIFADIKDKNRSCKLNFWSIVVKNKYSDNLFNAVEPLSHSDRLELYSKGHSITPEETVTSESRSLFTLVAFAEKQMWKTGILQRCINALVIPKFRDNPEVYAVIDEQYRRLMRFKYETEYEGTPLITNGSLVLLVRKVVSLLGLNNTHDTTFFLAIPKSVDLYIEFLRNIIPINGTEGSVKDNLSFIFTLWSGSKIIDYEGGYKIVVQPDVLRGLSYMGPLLKRPDIISILETPM